MVTSALLMLLAASASTTPDFFDVRDFPMDEEIPYEAAYQERLRRGTPEVTNPSISSSPHPTASSASFATSGSFSGSNSNSQGGSLQEGGFGMNPDVGSGSYGSYSGYYGVPTSYPSNTLNKQRPYFMPYDFYSLFQQFFRQLQIMAQQHAYAANYYTPSIESNTVDYGTAQSSEGSGTAGGSFNTGVNPGYSNTGYAPPVFFGFPYGGGKGSSFGSFSGSGSDNGGFDSSGTLSGAGEIPAIASEGTAGGAGSSLVPPRADVVGAAAVANLSPQGGFGYADVFPDISSRFGAVGGEFPKTNGNNYGVFTSSSSGSSDVNGKKTSFKTATTGINDNGKITVFTKHDP